MVEEVKAMVTLEPKKMELKSLPYPKELPENALVAKLRMAGICGTDYHILEGHLADLPWPIIQGHEIVAEVYETGDAAARQMEVHGYPLEKGDRITWPCGIPCGKCWYCRWLANNLRGMICENILCYGITLSCKNPPHLFGAFSEYVYVRPDVWVYKIPKDLPDKVAILVDTLASVNGIDRAISRLPCAKEGFMWGDTALVQGSGPIGLMAALKFREYGADKVIMVGGTESRLKMAERFGVDHTINTDELPRPEKRIEEVKKLTEGRGADIVLEAAGAAAAFPEGIEMVRKGGIYIEMGCATDTGSIPVNPYNLCVKDLVLISQYGYPPQQYERDLKLLHKWWRNKEYPLEDIITHQFKIKNVEEGIKIHKAHKLWKSMKCIVTP